MSKTRQIIHPDSVGPVASFQPSGEPDKRRVATLVHWVCLFAGAFALLGGLSHLGPRVLNAANAGIATRERVSIDADWRFTKNDPPNVDTSFLRYDTRSAASPPGRATSQPAIAPTTAPSGSPVLKAWILPAGNPFMNDAARRYRRPAGNPGEHIAYVQAGYDDSRWQRVDLPHDWAIAGPFDTGSTGVGGGMGRLPSPGVGWYRKKLDLEPGDANRRIFLDVDGAMSYAAVWLNGKLVGGWPYGYASWRLDLTPYVRPGQVNQLAIRLDNPPDSSRWYPGGGLFRNVWLVKTNPIHVGHWGTDLTTPAVSSASATVALRLTIDNDSDADATVTAKTELYALDEKGAQTGASVAAIAPADITLRAHCSQTVDGSAELAHPHLWGPPPTQKPNRYVAVTTLYAFGQPIDRYETRFGVRSILYKPDGLYVNGERIYLKGVNDHHDLGALGAAFNTRAAQRQLQELREMGCNALRTCHNPPAPELLELTDRMGILVLDEIFDCWYRQKTPHDFHLIFEDWHEQDLRAFLRRDRNCPSVVLWSVGNEVGEQFTGEPGAAVARELCGIVHQEDPTRPATASMNIARPGSPFADAFDVISLNYQGIGIRNAPSRYPAFRDKYPQKTILSTETAAALSTRGEYEFPVSPKDSLTPSNGNGQDPRTHQVSDYAIYAAPFGTSADRVFSAQEHNTFAAGEFVWSGWDYLGEPTPFYSSRSSYFGIIDLAGFPKDQFYEYQAEWRPDLPMAHILPHWTWPDRLGKVTPVHVFTSGDEAELFLNGKSLGRKKRGPFEYRLRWDDVIYAPGELKVVAYKNQKPWATDTVKTAGAPAKLSVSADRTRIDNDGRDLSFVTVRVLDKDGVLVPGADELLRFTIDGPGQIVATDNGDPTNFEPFHAPQRKAFHGLALVIVRSKPGESGRMTLTATAEAMPPASLTLRSGRPAD